jgi:2-oxoglutarate ferredoxin oxidoreductase subunit beta
MNSLSKRSVWEGFQQAKKTNAQKWRDNLPTWCPGCGHFTALHGLYEAVEKLQIPPQNFVVVSGIGCSGRFPFFIKGFGVHALHGRAVPLATGVKIANPELEVVIVGGDGDGLGIGGGHFPHAARHNFNMTYLFLDNSIYGLTKGQISPTSPLGMKSATSPYGNIAQPLNPTSLAIMYGATFVARVFSKDKTAVTEIVTRAIQHSGFSFVHVLSPCIQFNNLVTYESWADVVKLLPSIRSLEDKTEAVTWAESDKPIYVGLFYNKNIPTFDDRVKEIKNKLKANK